MNIHFDPVSKQTLFPSVPVPSTAYPDVALEEEVEEEDTAVEETKDQQILVRGDSGVKSPIYHTDSTFPQTSAHITVPLSFKYIKDKNLFFTLNKSSFI